MSRKGNTFSFRLRKIDADLEAAVKDIDDSAISDLCRDGLRLVLGLKTTKRIEITEHPIFPPEANAVSLRSKPAVFIPQKKPIS